MKKRMILVILIGFMLMIGLAACGLLTKTQKDDPFSGMQLATLSGTLENESSNSFFESTANPNPDLGPFILMLDDFSDRNSGWEETESEYGLAEYEDGGYHVEAYQQNEYYWGVPGQDFDDVRIEVDVNVLETNSEMDDGYGVDCRIQENGDGYGFRISSDGYVAITLFLDTEPYSLLEWTPSDAVYVDGRTNHLTAICQGNHFSFLVNDIEVGDGIDDSFSHGDLALSAITFDSEPVSVLFDDIVVQQLGNPYLYEDQNTYTLSFTNPTRQEACAIYVVPAADEFWGSNLLPSGYTLSPGQDLAFDWITNNPVDIKVETCQHLVLFEEYEVDLTLTGLISLKEPRLIFHQDFSDYGDWPWGVMDGGTISNGSGGYYSVAVTEADKLLVADSGLKVKDVQVLSDVTLIRKGQKGMGIYGVACRLQSDGSGILFGIRGDGMTAIFKIKNGELNQLTEWVTTDLVEPGIASNIIEGDCVGSTFKMLVNGDYLNSVEDDEFINGVVGVAVYSPVGSTTQADFDYVDIYHSN